MDCCIHSFSAKERKRAVINISGSARPYYFAMTILCSWNLLSNWFWSNARHEHSHVHVWPDIQDTPLQRCWRHWPSALSAAPSCAKFRDERMFPALTGNKRQLCTEATSLAATSPIFRGRGAMSVWVRASHRPRRRAGSAPKSRLIHLASKNKIKKEKNWSATSFENDNICQARTST